MTALGWADMTTGWADMTTGWADMTCHWVAAVLTAMFFNDDDWADMTTGPMATAIAAVATSNCPHKGTKPEKETKYA